ncbi:MAG: nitroreductase/quinone reductase family protein [Actinomycetota bacterium]
MDHLPDDIRAALAADMTIDITTIGRRSGEPRRIEIWYVIVDGRCFIAGTPGRRDWMANLRNTPEFTFHLKGSLTADLAARAQEVTDLAARRTLFEADVASWYRGQTPLDELIATAPVVEVLFD